MIKFLLEAILQVIILLPFAFIFLKKKSKLNFQRLLIFATTFIIYQVSLVLPKIDSSFNFIKSSWNWDGKIYGIICGIISYLLFKKYFRENDFFTLKQNKENFKPALIGAIGIVLIASMAWLLLGKSTFNVETLAFQISVPGIDEEIMFRGILLGLLATCLKDKIPFLGNPSILLTAILFAFTHALTLNKDYFIDFEPLYFIQTGFAGYIWGWITIKSRSILLAILSHNFSNFLVTLSTMIK